MANFETDTGWSWVHWYAWQNKFETKPEKVKQNKEKSELKNFANFETEIQTEVSFIKTLESSKSNIEPVTEFGDNEAKVDKTVEFIFNHNNDLEYSVLNIAEDETKPKVEVTFNFTNLVENVETGAEHDLISWFGFLKVMYYVTNVIQSLNWNMAKCSQDNSTSL